VPVELIADFVFRVAAAAFVALVLGLVWYAPFGFGDAWLEATGRQRERLGGAQAPMAASLVALVVSAVVLGILIRLAGIATAGTGAWLGLLAGVLVAAGMLSDYLFCAWPLSLFAIQAGYRVAYLVLMGVVFAVWGGDGAH
jgi:hypothetical protein